MAGMLRGRLGAVLDPAGGPDPLVDALRGAAARLPVPVVTDRASWEAVEPATRDGLLDGGRAALTEPWPVLLSSDWARTFRDGVRTAYEDTARELRERAARLVLAAVLTGEVAGAGDGPGAVPLLDGAADALVALAEASTWCWAPHDGFTAARHEVLPDPGDPYLDLGAAEVCALLAWADHALGPHLDRRVPGLRRRLRREVERRVLVPFERRRDWPWIGLRGDASNWNPWIHGAVLTAALLLVEDGPRQARLVRLVVEGLDRYLATLPADGGIDEGVAYWWQGACRLLEALDLLAAAGGPALDARDLPLLAELARFPHRMDLGDGWQVNAGDAAARPSPDQPWHVLFTWGTRLGDDRIRRYALGYARPGPVVHPAAGLGRALTGLADPAWRHAHQPAPPHAAAPGETAVPGEAAVPWDAAVPGEAAVPGDAAVSGEAAVPGDAAVPGEAGAAGSADVLVGGWLEREVWLPGVQVMVARERGERLDGLAVAAKAGHNREHHNHLDVGTYWVVVDGRPVLVDAGQPTYTATSFTSRRYEAWPVHSSWHNVPEPGAAQQPGVEHAAREVRVALDDEVAELSCELAAAYPPGQLDSWRRTVRLLRGDPPQAPAEVVVEDRWSGAPREVLLRHLVAGEVELDPDGTGALIRPDLPAGTGAPVRSDPVDGTGVPVRPALRISWGAGEIIATVERRELDDPLLVRSWGGWLTRLTLAVTSPTGAGAVTVRFTRAGGYGRQVEPGGAARKTEPGGYGRQVGSGGAAREVGSGGARAGGEP